MDFSFQRLLVLLFALTLTNSVTGAPNGTTQGRFRQNKAFFGSAEDDDSGEVKTIFPDSGSASDETSSEFKFTPGETKVGAKVVMDEEKAIDAILTATRTGRQLDLDKIDEEQLNQVISDPAIKEQLEAGNEGEARGIIRDKLCALGLMTCGGQHHHHKPHYGHGHHYKPRPQAFHHAPSHHAPSHHTPSHHVPHFEQPHYGQGIGHLHGGSIPARDVSLVQPVAVQPVGGPISAIPLNSGHSHLINKPYHGKPAHPPPFLPPQVQYNGGYAKQSYGPPPPPVPIYNPRPPAPPYNPPKTIYPSPQLFTEPITQPILPSKVVEVVHHHVHHKGPGGPSLGKESYGEFGVIGSQFGGPEEGYYGAAQKQVVSVATPGGKDIGSFAQPQTLTPNYLGPPSHARTCICVPIEQCILDGQEKSAELEIQATRGTEVIQGTGVPNSGLVGYGIDPRNKGRSLGIESNGTAEDSGESQDSTDPDSDEDDESQNTTVAPEDEVTTNGTTRVKRDTATNSTKGLGLAQPRRLDNGNGCRIRSIGSICCDPHRIRNPMQRQIPISQLTGPIPSNSFNQHVAYNQNALGGGGATPFYGQCGKRNAQGGIHGRVITAAANSLTDGETDFGEVSRIGKV